MPRTTDLPPQLKLPLDKFLYRLLAGMAAGTALLLSAFAANQTYQRIPIAQRVMRNHAISSVGRAGEFLFAYPYVALTAAVFAFVVSLAALAWVRRPLLVAAFLSNFAAAGVMIATEVALSRVWTWLTTSLTS